ncbi:hypothetical protein EON68_00815, partial [archaeon]
MSKQKVSALVVEKETTASWTERAPLITTHAAPTSVPAPVQSAGAGAAPATAAGALESSRRASLKPVPGGAALFGGVAPAGCEPDAPSPKPMLPPWPLSPATPTLAITDVPLTDVEIDYVRALTAASAPVGIQWVPATPLFHAALDVAAARDVVTEASLPDARTLLAEDGGTPVGMSAAAIDASPAVSAPAPSAASSMVPPCRLVIVSPDAEQAAVLAAGLMHRTLDAAQHAADEAAAEAAGGGKKGGKTGAGSGTSGAGGSKTPAATAPSSGGKSGAAPAAAVSSTGRAVSRGGVGSAAAPEASLQADASAGGGMAPAQPVFAAVPPALPGRMRLLTNAVHALEECAPTVCDTVAAAAVPYLCLLADDFDTVACHGDAEAETKEAAPAVASNVLTPPPVVTALRDALSVFMNVVHTLLTPGAAAAIAGDSPFLWEALHPLPAHTLALQPRAAAGGGGGGGGGGGNNAPSASGMLLPASPL